MIGSNAFNFVNLLDKAADASWVRNEVIANNIANVDTPDYKRKDVNFEQFLMEQMTSGKGSIDKRVANLNLAKLNPEIVTDLSELSYRYDGNNVDIDTESSYMADNQIKYYTLLNSMTQEFNRLKAVLQK
ncbi:MAG: flagellar basal body rod protein FlgB [Lachnospiraceae bacterium]|nr:flagellar basal body rod protein FlgB [Lachnospiraceae bacterium]